MPGRLFLQRPLAQIAADLGVPLGDLAPEPPRANIAPGQQIITYDRQGFSRRRWGLIPVGRVNARGRPVMETLINARSETVFSKSAYAGTGRAVVPADGWYEWTGAARRKTAWRITSAEGAPLWFAAITDLWQGPGGVEVPQVAMVTCPPNAQVAKVHHRMGVLLRPADIACWLEGSVAEVTPLMVPFAGRLRVQEAGAVDWDGA